MTLLGTLGIRDCCLLSKIDLIMHRDNQPLLSKPSRNQPPTCLVQAELSSEEHLDKGRQSGKTSSTRRQGAKREKNNGQANVCSQRTRNKQIFGN